MSPADLLRAYVDTVWAAVIHIGLLCALAAAITAAAAWAARRTRRRRPADDDAELAAGCDRLRAAIRDTQTPGSTAWLHDLYQAPAAHRPNTR